MTALVQATSVPAESQLATTLGRAQFYDAYSAALQDVSLSPAEIAARLLAATPGWANRLMRLRNAIVRRLGLKDVGDLKLTAARPAGDIRPGDDIGIFKVVAVSAREILLGIDDSHLDVRVSVVKSGDGVRYTTSTVVYIHNWLGRLYMLPVARIHPLIVRVGMRRAKA